MNLLLCPVKLCVGFALLSSCITGIAAPQQDLNKIDASHPLHHAMQRLNSTWWYDAGFDYSALQFTSDPGNNERHYDSVGRNYHLSLTRLLGDGLMLSVGYSRSSGAMASRFKLNNTATEGTSSAAGNTLKIGLRKMWQQDFYLSSSIEYGNTQNKFFQSINPGNNNAYSGGSSFDGNMLRWAIGTGFVYPINQKWVASGGLQLSYSRMTNDAYSVTYSNNTTSPQEQFVEKNWDMSAIANMKYVVTEHIRPYVELTVVRNLSQKQNRSVDDSFAPSVTDIPTTTLARLAYGFGGGVEFTWDKKSLVMGVSHLRRGSELQQNYIFAGFSMAV